jgi:RNA polymerase sigma factor (sigma-70 family)
LVAAAAAEWGLVEQVIGAFVTTCVRGLLRAVRNGEGDGPAPNADDPEVQALAKEVGETLVEQWKDDALTVLSERVRNSQDGRSAANREGGPMASLSTSGRPRVVVDDGRDFLSRLASAGKHRPPRAWQSAATVDGEELSPAARDLYAKNYQFVLRLATAARKRHNLPESVDDQLEAVAIKSLTRAARTYNPLDARGASFNTFLYSQITPDLAKAGRKLRQQRGMTSDEGEVEGVPDVGRVVEASAENENLRRLLAREIKRLPPRQAEIIELNMGMNDQPRLSLRQISEKMGMHEVSVRRLFGLGLNGLRQALAGQGVEAFLSTLFADAVGDGGRPTLTRRAA